MTKLSKLLTAYRHTRITRALKKRTQIVRMSITTLEELDQWQTECRYQAARVQAGFATYNDAVTAIFTRF